MPQAFSHQPATFWFAVFSKPRREAEAAEQLERQSYRAFLPLSLIHISLHLSAHPDGRQQ